MKKGLICISFLLILIFISVGVNAQCAMCTKTAQQLGEKPAAGMNAGIIYLMLTPFAIVAFIAYRWWRNRDRV